MIIFRDLRNGYGTKSVLEGFSLEIKEGETMAIIGYSGSGKSVALKHIVGILTPDSGHVEVDGSVVDDLDAKALRALRSTIGYVFQFSALFDSMTVADNIALGLKRQGLAEREIIERIEESLALVDLTGTDETYPVELSGGMRKRVGIARAIALRPKYILYDEPTTGLDPVTTAMMDELMIRVREKLGVTGIAVTHDMKSAYKIADRIAMLYHGKVRHVGNIEETQRSHDAVVRQFIEGRPEAAADAGAAQVRG